MNDTLPTAFNGDNEPSRTLRQAKSRAAKDFRWSTKRSREDAVTLAYWLHASGREEEALEVTRFLTQATFGGDQLLWFYIEGALALEAFILREQGKNEEAAICVERIQAVIEAIASSEFFERRFVEGDGLPILERNADEAILQRKKVWERAFLTSALQEICTLLALDVCRQMPAEILQERYQQHSRRLANLL